MVHNAAYFDDDPERFRVRRRPRRASSTGWSLRIATVCLAIACCLVVADLVMNWTRALGDNAGRTTDTAPIVLFVGDQRLTIPANMFRFENQRSVGPHEHIELAVHWPSLEGYTPERRADFLDGSATAPVLYLTIRRRETATDSAGRLANIYQHFLGAAIEAPEGLMGRKLSEESGLEGEEVFFEPGSTDPFTTHCLQPDGSGYPPPCLTEIHAGQDLSVQLRFRRGLLGDWQGIKGGMRRLLLGFGIVS